MPAGAHPRLRRNRGPAFARYRFMPSTVIRRYAYARDRAALEVTFTTGRRYRYFMVPAYVVDGLNEAFSKGRYFNARIRNRFPYEELDGEEDEGDGIGVTSPGTGTRRRP